MARVKDSRRHNKHIIYPWEIIMAQSPTNPVLLPLSFLSPEQVARIDQLLAELGDYGEIRLVVQRGELRYFNIVVSHKAPEHNKPKDGGDD